MTQGVILDIIQSAVLTVITAAAPMMIVAITVGLLVSIFQATTQINEQTLAFVPKIVAVLLSVMIFGSFIMTTIMNFTVNLYNSINNIII